MENNSNQENGLTNANEASSNGNIEITKEEIQQMVNQIQSVVEGFLSPLGESLKNLSSNYKSLGSNQTISNQISSLKPVIEKVQKDGKLSISLNGETLVDIKMPNSTQAE